jgi:hypothetical protein
LKTWDFDAPEPVLLPPDLNFHLVATAHDVSAKARCEIEWGEPAFSMMLRADSFAFHARHHIDRVLQNGQIPLNL